MNQRTGTYEGIPYEFILVQPYCGCRVAYQVRLPMKDLIIGWIDRQDGGSKWVAYIGEYEKNPKGRRIQLNGEDTFSTRRDAVEALIEDWMKHFL